MGNVRKIFVCVLPVGISESLGDVSCLTDGSPKNQKTVFDALDIVVMEFCSVLKLFKCIDVAREIAQAMFWAQ